jgi:hypothetical protein
LQRLRDRSANFFLRHLQITATCPHRASGLLEVLG